MAVHFAVAYRRPGGAQNSRIFVMNPYAWNAKHQGTYSSDGGSRPSTFNRRRDLIWPKFLGWDAREKAYYDFGELLVEPEGIDWKYILHKEMLVSPPQRGYFTIQGTDRRPLDEIAPDLLVAIDLTEKAISEARHQLNLVGVNEYRLFPDSDGLSLYLRARYEVE